jgi:hypothetical protein
MISTRRRAIGAAAIGLLLVACVAVSYGLQLHSGSSPFLAGPTARTSPSQPVNSYIYSDATSVQYLAWSEVTGGALQGVVYELQDVSPGSPSFLTSTLNWTGTRTAQELSISIPGATSLATLEGNTLVRQEMDPRTGTLVTERWVRGTLSDYTTLIEAFRDYVLLGQALQGITFALQSAQQNPPGTWVMSSQVQGFLHQAEDQLAALQGIHLPHLSGLLTPWVISPGQINATLRAAEQFLSTPTAGAVSSNLPLS